MGSEMKKIITTLLILATSIYGELSPNLPSGTPSWADDSDLHVARVIMGEARGEGNFGMTLVADNIQTRVRQDRLTPYEVVIKPNQYHGYTDQNDPTEHVWDLVAKLKLDQDILPDVEFYFFKRFRDGNHRYRDSVIYKNHIHYNKDK